MQKKIAVCFVIIIAALVLASGCTILSPPPQPTPVPTPEPTVEPTSVVTTATPTPEPTLTASTIPGPTQDLPPQWPVSISVEKAGTYSMTIITHFDGGKGMSYVLQLESRVTRPDGSVTTKSIDKPVMGDTIEIEGSNGTDRVEVSLVMKSGDRYTVIDQQMPYKSH